MSCESFKAAVNKLVKKAGGGISVRFSNAGGKYFADFIADDVTIIGNPVSTKVTVRWNYRNHQSMVNIA